MFDQWDDDFDREIEALLAEEALSALELALTEEDAFDLLEIEIANDAFFEAEEIDRNNPFEGNDEPPDDWRYFEAFDADGDLRGPFPEFEDAQVYIESLQFLEWELLYDADSDAWFAEVGYRED